MPATLLNAIAQSSAERIVNCTFEGMVLALIAWFLLRMVPRQNAGTRFSVWMAILVSIAALPLVEGFARIDGSVVSAGRYAPLAVPASWGTALFLVWLVIASALLLRIAVGLVQLRRLRDHAREVNLDSLDELPRQTLTEFQSVRAVSLCVSESVSVPTAVGLFRPAVVLPTWAVAELSASDLNSLLIHELAHLRRRDDWTNLLQKLVRAVLFFHPAVWWIENLLSLEREMACDEQVLVATENPRAYAECLVSLAEKGFLHRAAMLAQGALHRLRECSARVSQILDSARPGTARVSRTALTVASSGSVLLLIAFAHAPDLVAFRSQAPAQIQAAAQVEPASFSAGDRVAVTPATWHADKGIEPRVVPTKLVTPTAASTPDVAATTGKADSPRSTPSRRKSVAKTAQPRPATPQAAPQVYRASFAQQQLDSIPATLVVFTERGFYSDGAQVWTVSFYRMTVLRPQPAVQNEIPRKAI